jgi:hypothetical protein
MDLRKLSEQAPVERSSEETPLVPREVRFTISYRAPDGVKYTGALVSRVPNGDERMSIDRRAAVLAGAPWAHLSEYSQARCLALALVSVQLRDMPEWVATWAAEDDELLFALRGECERHSAAWFRATLGASAADPSASRVAVTSSDLAPT